MRYIFSIVMILLSGCVAVPPVYNPSNIPIEQLATITQFKTNKLAEYHWAFVHEVYNQDNLQVIGPKPINASHEMVSLMAGTYHFVFRCDDGATYSFLESTETLEPGEAYTIYCEKVIEKGGLMGLDKITGNKVHLVKSSEFSPELIKDVYY